MITAARLIEQRFPLASGEHGSDAPPAADARRAWTERRTLVLVLEDGDGNVGLGEAAPLPGYSPDTLDDAWNALAPLVGAPLAERALGAPDTSRELLRLAATLPSPAARFALESALLDLFARGRGEPAWSLLSQLGAELEGASPEARPVARNGCAVAALISSNAERACLETSRAVARTVRTFKMKIGTPGAWTEELAALRAVRRAFPDVALRADANQAFSADELRERLPALRDVGLEWLEEPTARFGDGWEGNLGVPVALDESLQRTAPEPAAARDRGVGAYVLKPTALGGFVRSFELARDARSAGLGVVTSHVYESALGISAIAALALARGPGRPADGLDRHVGIHRGAALPAFDDHGRLRASGETGFGLSLAALFERSEIVREVAR